MKRLEAADVAKLLVEYGDRLALKGESRFKTKAYRRAAQSLAALSEPLAKVIAQGRLTEIFGIGAAIAAKIEKFHESGTDARLETLRQEAPSGALALLRIPGLRTDQALRIHDKLAVTSVEALEAAARAGRLAETKGLGPALQRKVLQAIQIMRRSEGARLIHHAERLLEAAADNLRRSHPELRRIALAGSLRRGCELVPDLRLVAETDDGGKPRVTRPGGEVELHAASKRDYGVALLFATGSEEHVSALQRIAQERGLALEPTGLRRGGRPVACAEEKQVYKALGLPFIEPELREDRGEIELALTGQLPKLVTVRDIRGVLHSHTDASDGIQTLEEMAEATRERGYAYYGVSDHSQTASYAGGLKPEEIAPQQAEADALNRGFGKRFRILKGIESDILQDGALDYPDEMLDRFDFVIASVHGRFGLDEKAQTERLVRAVADPRTTVLGHMTGRLLLRREGYEIDIDRVLEACAEHGVAVEINGNPNRLDLDWRWHQRALELGCMLSINPDAHSIAELDLVRWGVTMARKGGVPKERVLTCFDLEAMTAHLRKRKERARRRPSRSKA